MRWVSFTSAAFGVEQRELGALACEMRASDAADAAPGAGHENGLAANIHVLITPVVESVIENARVRVPARRAARRAFRCPGRSAAALARRLVGGLVRGLAAAPAAAGVKADSIEACILAHISMF